MGKLRCKLQTLRSPLILESEPQSTLPNDGLIPISFMSGEIRLNANKFSYYAQTGVYFLAS